MAALLLLAMVHGACFRAGLGPAEDGHRWIVPVAGVLLEASLAGAVLRRPGQTAARWCRGRLVGTSHE